MTEDDRRYLGDQLAMFEGGYEHLCVTFCCYLDADLQTVAVNYLVRETATFEWVACQVPVWLGGLLNLPGAAAAIEEVLTVARERMAPFP